MENFIRQAIPYWYNREVYNPETRREDVKVKNLPKNLRDRYKPKTSPKSTGKPLTENKKQLADDMLKDPKQLDDKYVDIITDRNMVNYMKSKADKSTRKKLDGYDKLFSHSKNIHSQGREPSEKEKVKSESIKVVYNIDDSVGNKLINKAK